MVEDSEKPENKLSAIILDAAIEVHRQLGGPGLLEDVYEEALACELELRGVKVERQVPVQLEYKGRVLRTSLRVDLIVDGLVVVECKATTHHNEVFEAQALTYARLTDKRLALLINFGKPRVVDGFRRIANGL